MKKKDTKFLVLCNKINLEDILAGRSADFSFGRIEAMEEEDPALAWGYEKWADFCFKVGRDVEEVMKGLTFQRSVNEAVRNAIRGM